MRNAFFVFIIFATFIVGCGGGYDGITLDKGMEVVVSKPMSALDVSTFQEVEIKPDTLTVALSPLTSSREFIGSTWDDLRVNLERAYKSVILRDSADNLYLVEAEKVAELVVRYSTEVRRGKALDELKQ